MFALIDLYCKDASGKWVYFHATRMFPTLAAAKVHYERATGVAVQSRWA